MKYGFWGKILRVDLGKRSISIEEPSEQFYRQYLGGSALALYYLLRELDPKADPLGPDNKLVFAASPLVGVPAPGLSRYTVAAKSPLTGGFGEAEAGGWWGPELKFAGFDAVIIEGSSERPVYLWITDRRAEIKDAQNIWGKDSAETREAIRQDVGDEKAKIAAIGPAGERLVKYACIANEIKHVNGRTGLGAVMGSKNLKAVAIRGHGKIAIKDPEALISVARWFSKTFKTSSAGRQFYETGTAGGLSGLNNDGMLPTFNFRTGEFEHADKLSGEYIAETILKKSEGCYACPVRCKKTVEVNEPDLVVNPIYGGPEYESVAALGSLCGVGDIRAVAKANELCNKYVLDTISTGAVIAFAMECFENGILTPDDTDGIDLRFGNADALLKMVEMIVFRKGVGDILAEGVKRAAAKIGRGSARYALQVKGQELPMHEPRGKVGVGLAYALASTGPDHMEAAHDTDFEIPGPSLYRVAPLGLLEPVSALNLGPEKVRLFVYLQYLWSMYNSAGICDFVAFPINVLTFDHIVQIFQAVTGWDINAWELMKIGERTTTMARLFNVRAGFSSEDDILPERFFEPLEGGALKGMSISKDDFHEAVRLYYAMMGWNQDGIPTDAKLHELGLSWATTTK